ncbi:hypothetical protein D8M34_17675 [Microbacterium sp. HSID17254]|nr:hypothetical protein D8M34_17675 [Microbacterium sp. HSID17254]
MSASTASGSWAEPRCSISREPAREPCTIWTAVAPDPVRTVRTYATDPSLRTREVPPLCRSV